MALNSNFRPLTEISGQLDHSNMQNWLCGEWAGSEMFPGTPVSRNWSQNLWGFAIFHTASYTEDVWKIAKPPKYGFRFSKQAYPERSNFLRFWIFFLGLLWKFFFDFLLDNFSWLPHMHSAPQKVVWQKPNVKFFMVAPYVEVTSIVKSLWDSITKHVWVYSEKSNIDFWPQIYSWLPNMYSDSQKRWPRKLGSPLNWDSQKVSKMRRIVKFDPRGNLFGKSGHWTP